jgi:hypothetical protein
MKMNKNTPTLNKILSALYDLEPLINKIGSSDKFGNALDEARKKFPRCNDITHPDHKEAVSYVLDNGVDDQYQRASYYDELRSMLYYEVSAMLRGY